MQRAPHIVVGIDLTHKSDGALVLASWMRASAGSGSTEIDGVYLVSHAGPRAVCNAYLERARYSLAQLLADRRARDTFNRVEVVETLEVAAGLACFASGAKALVIGRRTRPGERALVHLGPVARRIVRGLPVPVIVVPPELIAETVGRGPVVLAIGLKQDCDEAVRFAAGFAREHGRELVLLHTHEFDGADYFYDSAPGWRARRGRDRLEAEVDFEGWAAPRGLNACRTIVLCGSLFESLIGIAAIENPSLLVLAARRSTWMGRVFTVSTSNAVAAHAACPVALVPPADPMPATRPVRVQAE